MTIRGDTDDLIEFLNELLALDPVAISNLVGNRVTCNEALAHHPSVQVRGEYGERGVYTVGLLGILNGYCGTIDGGDKNGWGPITAVMSHDDRLGITRFERTAVAGEEPCGQCGRDLGPDGGGHTLQCPLAGLESPQE